MATISTHNGSAVARQHNLRNRKVTDKEEHINPNGIHETWLDEREQDAYERLFGDAVREYNEKQKRSDRKIYNYHKSIKEDKKKHTAYEMIVGVYKKNENISERTCHDILKEYVRGWSERNPNLELIGAYYHADEEGEPHIHIDYIPVAHGYTRGMETQTGLVKALEEQGFCKNGKATAQIQWEARENATLEALCVKRGINVEHPERNGEKKEHMRTEQYKAQKELEKTYNELQNIGEQVVMLERQGKEREQQNNELQQRYDELKQVVDTKEPTKGLFKKESTVTLTEREYKLYQQRTQRFKELEEAERKTRMALQEAERIKEELEKEKQKIVKLKEKQEMKTAEAEKFRNELSREVLIRSDAGTKRLNAKHEALKKLVREKAPNVYKEYQRKYKNREYDR